MWSRSAEHARRGIFGLLVLLGGCALQPPGVDPGAGLPARAQVGKVPFHPQSDQQCGPAALAMALGWSGLDITPGALADAVMSPARDGSLQPSLIAAARRHGRLAYAITGPSALYTELAAGHPVIVLQNLGLPWLPAWHYAVATGYDRSAGTLRLHSGTHADLTRTHALFERTWARGGHWGLVVLPPGELPASAAPLSYLEAAAGLERAGRMQAASRAYAAATARWPEHAETWIALGNARYAQRDLPGAEAALREAVAHGPGNAAAWNNLAQVLLERGAAREAVAAAERAVAAGGAHPDTYRATLEAAQASVTVRDKRCPCTREVSP